MCCEPNEIHQAMRGCCEHGPFFRRYLTAKEKQEMLQAYREQLQNELKGVEERIKELERKEAQFPRKGWRQVAMLPPLFVFTSPWRVPSPARHEFALLAACSRRNCVRRGESAD